MSYEGSVEYLCAKGHWSDRDCNDEDLKVCPECGARMAYVHHIDETNGYLDTDTDYSCRPAPVVQIGEEMVTVSRPIYRPDLDAEAGWMPLPAPPADAAKE